MISFRHHVVSLVAVFLALAIGVVLGGGPLADLGRPEAASPATETASTNDGRTIAFADDFAAAAATRLYAGRLKDRPVSLVTMPGSDDATVADLAAQVEAAGGYIASTFAVLPTMVDPSKKALVDALGTQLVPQLEKGAVDPGSSTYVRAGELVGLVVSSPNSSPQQAVTVGQSLEGAELFDVPESPSRAGLVLVVLGDDVNDSILAGLLSGLAGKAFGVVAAGDSTSAQSGDLSTLRATKEVAAVATVDDTEGSLGRVSAVLALIRSLKVKGGSFGASGSDGTVPLG